MHCVIVHTVCMWKEEIYILTGRKLIAEEKIIMNRNKGNIKVSLQEWKQNHLFSKLIGVFSKGIITRAMVSVISICFDHWKKSRETKKRVQMQLRMNNVRTVVT